MARRESLAEDTWQTVTKPLLWRSSDDSTHASSSPVPLICSVGSASLSSSG